MSLPTWPGADHCYTYLTRKCEEINAAKFAADKARNKRRKRLLQWTADPLTEQIVAALNAGDEETIKAWLLRFKLPLPPLIKPSRNRKEISSK